MSTLLTRKKFIQSALVAGAALFVGAPVVLAQTRSVSDTLNLMRCSP